MKSVFPSKPVYQAECYNPAINAECYNPEINAEAWSIVYGGQDYNALINGVKNG